MSRRLSTEEYEEQDSWIGKLKDRWFGEAEEEEELDEAFRKISDELRTQYLLAYYPSQRTSFSEFRRIEVKVSGLPDASAYHVRHRAGYYTVKSEF